MSDDWRTDATDGADATAGDDGTSRASRWSAGGSDASGSSVSSAGSGVSGSSAGSGVSGSSAGSTGGESDRPDPSWPSSWIDPVTGSVAGDGPDSPAVAERPDEVAGDRRRTPAGGAGRSEDATGGSADGAVLEDYRTGHWRGVGGVALFVGGLGLLLQQSGLVMAGVLGVVYAGYAASVRPPRTVDADGRPVVELDRGVTDATPHPGDRVGVEVTVRNAGGGVLPDVRVVDGVPAGMEVVDGSPRAATALRPGESVTFGYAVAVPRGEHEWTPARVVVADASGGVERETTVSTATSVRCVPPGLSTEELPLRDLTTPYTGRVPTDAAGDGVEFHSTREYQPGDPLRRIDWYRRAKTGELGTLEFREERAATVVVLVDARRSAYLAPAPAARHAVERSVDAAIQAFSALLDTGDRAGIAVFGGGGAWLAPGAGDEHRARGRDLLTTHPAVSPVPPERGVYDGFLPERREQLRARRVDRLHGRLPDDAQVIVLSPCCDDYAAEVVRRLDAYGHLVTLVSPNPTTNRGPGERLAQLERADRLSALRREGVRVLDWPYGEPFAATLERARARWSQ